MSSPDFYVTRYRLPWQCQDFLSGQETGGGRKTPYRNPMKPPPCSITTPPPTYTIDRNMSV
ncbi:hypothetical protein NQZ68_015650 [Dissostichus eleginoides]|nr:hypothetical protein NQZ68_015650 [Dissostichus eleginoides]